MDGRAKVLLSLCSVGPRGAPDPAGRPRLRRSFALPKVLHGVACRGWDADSDALYHWAYAQRRHDSFRTELMIRRVWVFVDY
jgi:hypothetical protein